MITIIEGCISVILSKYTDPVIKKAVKFAKGEWEKFKIDFDLAFIEYLRNTYEKYSKIKTILYKSEPKYIYDFFEVPFLQKNNTQPFIASKIDTILEISNFIIIQGIGGVGKSTLLKHLFIDEIRHKEYIPIFIELKDINDKDLDYELYDIIFDKISSLGSNVHKNYLEYALKAGCFLFMFDGYDEILSQKKDYFFKRMDMFCDKYPKNYYIISSRPYTEFIEFQRFTVLTVCSLRKEQAKNLINKIEFDNDIKKRFVADLDSHLYTRHRSFASNPLLLNIMLLTYDNYAEIPEKLHIFYSNAFETMYSRHDATKAGYKRELESDLSSDSFKNIFSYFCIMTYTQGKFEFSYDELNLFLNKINNSNISFDNDKYINDLVNSLCVLYKDGISYKFTHRSFQEYFTAVFIKELSDDLMRQTCLKMIYVDIDRATYDSVFKMLQDMAEERFEKNVLLPIISDFEKDKIGDKYNLYFESFVSKIKFESEKPGDKKASLWIVRDVDEDITSFIYDYTHHYFDLSDKTMKKREKAAEDLLNYLYTYKEYQNGEEIPKSEIVNDAILFELIKKTWIGERIISMSKLYDYICKKLEKKESDISKLFSF